MNPRAKLYRKNSIAARVIPLAGYLGVGATLISIEIAVLLVWPEPHREGAQSALFLMAGIWGVGGPMWFFSEYFFFYRQSGMPNTWEQFKHGQQVSAAIWAGLSVSLAALGTSDMAKPIKDDWSCSLNVKSTGQSALSPSLQVALTNCSRAGS